MWKLLFDAFGGSAITGILGGVDKILGRFWKNKDVAEEASHNEQMAAMNAQAAEFQYRGDRFWLDSITDFINRLPRPIFALAVLGLMAFAPYDPIQFTIIMKAYEAVPEWLALVAAQVIVLFFGGRMMDKWKGGMTGMNKGQFKDFMGQMNELQDYRDERLKEDRTAAGEMPMNSDEYNADMADESTQLSNASIEEWNRRRKAGKQ